MAAPPNGAPRPSSRSGEGDHAAPGSSQGGSGGRRAVGSRRAAREAGNLFGPPCAASRGRPRARDRGLTGDADSCRVDIWLWRARFFKTRSLAARIVEEGGVRLSRGGARTPLDKPSRPVRCGDVLTFAQGSRWLAVRIEALGVRRGPATEARTLYSVMREPSARARSD